MSNFEGLFFKKHSIEKKTLIINLSTISLTRHFEPMWEIHTQRMSSWGNAEGSCAPLWKELASASETEAFFRFFVTTFLRMTHTLSFLMNVRNPHPAPRSFRTNVRNPHPAPRSFRTNVRNPHSVILLLRNYNK